MGEVGDIFDMFSNEDDDDKRTSKKNNAQDDASANDWKSAVMGKLSKNKPLLMATVVAGIAILAGLAFFIVKYIGANGVKGIIDNVKPFLN
jgi:hypothetical protein